MVATMSKRFDPAEHLTKQGWKGKGTALKTGHLTRPLAVIQKKTLSGVGKDRDEAVPFWDQIFAATAASLSLPFTPLSTSPASTPPPSSSGQIPKLADPRSNKSGSWQTSGSSGSANHQPLGQAGLSVGVRIARDVARRGLYSRFFRGEDVVEKDLEESGAKCEVSGGNGAGEAGPSRPRMASPPVVVVEEAVDVEMIPAEEGLKETREERKARKALKARRKEEKAEKKAGRAAEKAQVGIEAEGDAKEDMAVSATIMDEEGGKGGKKRKRRTGQGEGPDLAAVEPVGSGEVGADGIREKEKKKKKKKDKRGGGELSS